MNHWLRGYYEILPQISCPWCDLRCKIIRLRLEKRGSTCGSNFNSPPKDLSVCIPDAAAKHPFHWDSNVFPPADTTATFQFELHLKPPISAAGAGDWNMKPCIYTGHYRKSKAPAAVCLLREVKGEETTGISFSQNTFLFIYYSITLNSPLTPPAAAHAKLPSEENGSLAESGGNQTESLGLSGMRVQIWQNLMSLSFE